MRTARPVTLASLRGKTVVLSPSSTLCQEICPLISANFGAADRDVRQPGPDQKRRVRGSERRPAT